MKTTISFVLMAFLVLLGVTKSDVVSGQVNESLSNPGSLERTVPMVSAEMYNIPLICDGVEIDRLIGRLEVFCRMHYENGKIVWMIHNFSGSLTSKITGEVFDINGTRKIDMIEKDLTFRANIKGDQGSHYILSGYKPSGKDLIIDKAVCPQSADE